MGTLSRSPDYEALSFFFAPAFYRQQPLGAGLDGLPFFALDATPYLQVPSTERPGLEEPVIAMEQEFRAQASDWQAVVHAYLSIFFVRLRRLYCEHAVAQSRATTTRQALAASFKRLVDQRFGQMRAGEPVDSGSIRAYATTLGVEESYLSEVVREVTGRNPSDLVRERLSLEARYLVRYSALTIGEIADLLGFSDVSYFSRWFKQHIGIPPAQYRR
jgi:AraC family transcriptional activator of pobA